MTYSIQDVQEELSIVPEDIEKYISEYKIKVGKSGRLSAKSFKMLASSVPIAKGLEINIDKKPIYILNGNKIEVKKKPVFESNDHRISLFQDDAISFLKNLPDSSVDLIVTDPAYSGMNQKLKLGRGKIIGKYKEAGKDGAKWFEEFHDTEENY
ncbi:MAG: hypothetical protein Q8N05_15675, partial [Bacteroidota bacterium]|nr:hypothetical protein [Bacteroidota bacterium]